MMSYDIMYTVLVKLQMMQDISADLTYCKANDPDEKTQNHTVVFVHASVCRIRGNIVLELFIF